MFSYHLTFATAKVIQIFDMCKYFFHFMEIILWKNRKKTGHFCPVLQFPIHREK